MTSRRTNIKLIILLLLTFSIFIVGCSNFEHIHVTDDNATYQLQNQSSSEKVITPNNNSL
ncbi:hypothetical protein ACFL56_01970 [Candidatus Margulisiibacteriota bacterium]